jgi:hypothetical protein
MNIKIICPLVLIATLLFTSSIAKASNYQIVAEVIPSRDHFRIDQAFSLKLRLINLTDTIVSLRDVIVKSHVGSTNWGGGSWGIYNLKDTRIMISRDLHNITLKPFEVRVIDGQFIVDSKFYNFPVGYYVADVQIYNRGGADSVKVIPALVSLERSGIHSVDAERNK